MIMSEHDLNRRLERLGQDLDKLNRNYRFAPHQAVKDRGVSLVAAMALCLAGLASLVVIVNLRADPNHVPSNAVEPSVLAPPLTSTGNGELQNAGEIRPTILLGGPAVTSVETPESSSFGASVADAVGALGLDLTLIESSTRSFNELEIQWTYLKGQQARLFVASGIEWVDADLSSQMSFVEQDGPVRIYRSVGPQGSEFVTATSGGSTVAISLEKIDPSEKLLSSYDLVELASLLVGAP